jgi:hypothetical protein
VVVLTGARQTGTTSTFKRLFANHMFVSLDLPTGAEQAEREPQNLLQRHSPPVIIDEVQYAPRLFRHLKVALEAARNRNGQFLLTGSPKFTLMKSVSESLAGRADIAELETLSLAEIPCGPPANRARKRHRAGRVSRVAREPGHRCDGLLQFLSGQLSGTRRAHIGQRRQPAGLRTFSARLCPPFRKPVEQG